MRDELLGYYERELTFLRQMGGEFAEKYPKIASRLLLEPDKCEDPHVERMIEAFAFMAGRVHLKIDDEFPQITESFFNVLYPHYLAPVPSMSLVQFSLDRDQAQLTSGYSVDRGSILYSRPVQGTPCRFRTCYPVTLWPIELTSAALESPDRLLSRASRAESMLRLGFRCLNGTTLGDLRKGLDEKSGLIDSLRFYLNGEWQLVYPLYEMILNQTERVEIRPVGTRKPGMRAAAPVVLAPSCLKAVGFQEDEALLPYTARSFPGYRLLTEYFCFPEKFLFFDVTGIHEAAARAGFGDEFEIVLYLREGVPTRENVDVSNFQLGCTPIVNLFQRVAEPIPLTQQQNEYQVVPDVHRQMATEIYSIDSVASTDPSLQITRNYQPFYSYRHSYAREEERIFWYASRRPSQRKDDPGTEVFLSLIDMGFNPGVPAAETLTVQATCTNRDLPGKLPFGGREADFETEAGRGLSKVRCLRKPTATLRPPLRRGAQWRLLSHLLLNPLSIVEGPGSAPEALQEILMLYDFMDSAATRKQIFGLQHVSSRRVVRQVGSAAGVSLVRGIETQIEFDEDQYVGSGVFLFASVLENFLGLYASVNSFSQLVAKTRQREGILKRWPARAGTQIVL